MRIHIVEDKNEVVLRQTKISDLEYLFLFQLDGEANYMAAFTANDPTDRVAYLEKFGKNLVDPTVTARTILVGEAIVGSIAKFEIEGDAEITYWIDRKLWGKGIATSALGGFLTIEHVRPIFGRVAFDNVGSQRVLEKCGFERIGQETGFANARQSEIGEFIYVLTSGK